jgi:hypothetical protein
LLFQSKDNAKTYDVNENGRFKEVKTKRASRYGKDMGEEVQILDTQTGEFVEH